MSDLTELKEPVEELYKKLDELLKLGVSTAQGEKCEKGISLAGVDAPSRDFANTVFPRGAVRIPAEILSMACLYDTTAAYARMNASLGKSRLDYYRQSADDLKVRTDRLAYEKALHVSAINISARAHSQQSDEDKK